MSVLFCASTMAAMFGSLSEPRGTLRSGCLVAVAGARVAGAGAWPEGLEAGALAGAVAGCLVVSRGRGLGSIGLKYLQLAASPATARNGRNVRDRPER